jgi:ferrous iron transport protein A
MKNSAASQPSPASTAPQWCPAPAACPLNRVRAGMPVRIKQLCTSDDTALRLREIGFCEDQVIRLLTASSNIICLVCNARLAISAQLAQSILVEPVAGA